MLVTRDLAAEQFGSNLEDLEKDRHQFTAKSGALGFVLSRTAPKV